MPSFSQIVFTAQYTRLIDGLPVNSRGIFIADPSPSPAVNELPGDYNGDDVVDAADYVTWRDNLGQSVVLPNDSSSGLVTQEDHEVWRANFGQSHATGNSLSAATQPDAIPEPATLFILSTGCVLLFATAKRFAS